MTIPHYAGGLKNGGFTLKMHQKSSTHTTPGKFENITITGHFGFMFEESSGREILVIIIKAVIVFEKLGF